MSATFRPHFRTLVGHIWACPVKSLQEETVVGHISATFPDACRPHFGHLSVRTTWLHNSAQRRHAFWLQLPCLTPPECFLSSLAAEAALRQASLLLASLPCHSAWRTLTSLASPLPQRFNASGSRGPSTAAVDGATRTGL